MTPRQMSVIRKKVAERTATTEEYRFLRHSERFTKRRRDGVNLFWEQERERIINNHKTTRNWSADQIRSILLGMRQNIKEGPLPDTIPTVHRNTPT